MLGYKIKINCLPQVKWATETSVSNYYWENRNTSNMLEIGYSTFDSKITVVNNQKIRLSNNSLSCLVGNEPSQSYSEGDGKVNILSVALNLSDFEAISGEITKSDFENNDYLLLPRILQNISLENEVTILTLLHKLIHYNSYSSESNRYKFISTFFELLTKIDTVIRQANDYKTVEHYDYYIKKTDAIIKEKYAEKLTLEDIALELNVSPVYLSSIYKKRTGISFKEKLLNVKMKKADELLRDRNIPTSKIAFLLGFCDENYFRKKFKQYFGINVGEYRKIKSGMTLLHQKPTPKSYKTQD